MPRRSFRMWSTVVCANPVSRASSRILWRRSLSSNAVRAYTSSSLTQDDLADACLPHSGVPRWRLLPTLPLFCKAMHIPRKPIEDLDDTVVLYGLWHIQSLSNSVVRVSKTSWQHYIRPPANARLCSSRHCACAWCGKGESICSEVTNVWYKQHYLVPLHGVSTAVLPLLKFQPSYFMLFFETVLGPSII